jgi:hypothetical protein
VLDVAATAIPLGKTILGKILGSKVEQAFLRGDKAAAEALAKESLFKVLASVKLVEEVRVFKLVY